MLSAAAFPVRLAMAGGIVTLVLTLLAVGFAFAARHRALRRAQRREMAEARWVPVLLRGALRNDDTVVALDAEDAEHVLEIWSHYAESLKGPALDRLIPAAQRLGLDVIARKELASSSWSRQLVAVNAAGNLRLADAWPVLEKLVRSHHPLLWPAAARALLQIDSIRGKRVVGEVVLADTEWHPTQLARILSAVDAHQAAGLVTDIIGCSPPQQVPRLVKVLAATRSNTALPSLRAMAASTDDGEILSACMQALARFRDPADAGLARRLLGHDQWFVRVQATAALSQICAREDEERLVQMLGDDEWWVRYRAAQGLVRWPWVAPGRLDELEASHHDRYGQDALRHARAEAAS